MTRLPVSPDDAGVRLDRFLRRALPRTPLAEIYRLIRTAGVKVGGKRSSQDYRLAAGDLVEAKVRDDDVAVAGRSEAPSALARTTFFDRNFRVLSEDDALLVCEKPPFIVVHPGSGHETGGTLIDLARAHLSKTGRGAEPFLVHRIDKDTSGIVLIAKGRQALRGLHDALRTGRIAKEYVLVCHGRPPRQQGSIEAGLARTFEENTGTKVMVSEEGSTARTDYRVLRSANGLSLVYARIHTGRTHQIRVHMAHIGCPIVGDVRYGDPEADLGLFARVKAQRRLYLHACRVAFPHPHTGRTVEVRSETPGVFETLVPRP